MSKFMLIPRKLEEYHEAFNEVASDMINILRKERGEENMYLNVPGLLNRWSFECKFNSIHCKSVASPGGFQGFLETSQLPAAHIYNTIQL